MPSNNHNIMDKIFNLGGVIDYEEEVLDDKVESKDRTTEKTGLLSGL